MLHRNVFVCRCIIFEWGGGGKFHYTFVRKEVLSLLQKRVKFINPIYLILKKTQCYEELSI